MSLPGLTRPSPIRRVSRPTAIGCITRVHEEDLIRRIGGGADVESRLGCVLPMNRVWFFTKCALKELSELRVVDAPALCFQKPLELLTT